MRIRVVNADSRIAFLFPGQGSQQQGMLARLRVERIGNALFEEAGSVLGRDLSELDSAAAQAGTWATQLGLLIVGVASARLLTDQGVSADFVAGHSVGAFAAAVHAQVVSFADALHLVDLRGRLMAQAYPHAYGMVAIAGVPERTLQAWIDDVGARGAGLHLANRNAARQFTVSGANADLDVLLTHALAHGAGKALRLAVAVPSHSPLMHDVAERMLAAMQDVHVADARIPFATNRRARIETDAALIADDLASGVAHPVLWHEINCALYERGVRAFIEMAPGSVLSNLALSAYSDVQAIALSKVDVSSLPAILRGPSV